MKTLLSILSILVLIATAILLDANRLDASGWFAALTVAALFGLALNDTPRYGRLFPRCR
jgi:hypothetical protein